MSNERRVGMTPARVALGDAEARLRAAADDLCVVVASIAAARGWNGGEKYEATPTEQRWHDRIRRVGRLIEELEEGAADVR